MNDGGPTQLLQWQLRRNSKVPKVHGFVAPLLVGTAEMRKHAPLGPLRRPTYGWMCHVHCSLLTMVRRAVGFLTGSRYNLSCDFVDHQVPFAGRDGSGESQLHRFLMIGHGSKPGTPVHIPWHQAPVELLGWEYCNYPWDDCKAKSWILIGGSYDWIK